MNTIETSKHGKEFVPFAPLKSRNLTTNKRENQLGDWRCDGSFFG